MPESYTERITVETTVEAPVEKVWSIYTDPEHITSWNTASEDWHTVRAENDLRVGGRFISRMEAKDGSHGFDFEGTYDEVVPHERIAYSFGDRKANVFFTDEGSRTRVVVKFDAETTNPIEMQRAGWQSILDHFKNYVESL